MQTFELLHFKKLLYYILTIDSIIPLGFAFYNGYITATCLKMHAEIFESSLVIPH